jgi:endogenous inhibitor of DNA gyrase (YacG/DUF329 family)
MMSEPDNNDPVPAKPCPICGKPAEPRWRPFCSKRCADVDLNRWLSGAYRGGRVCLNSMGWPDKWISASVMPLRAAAGG